MPPWEAVRAGWVSDTFLSRIQGLCVGGGRRLNPETALGTKAAPHGPAGPPGAKDPVKGCGHEALLPAQDKPAYAG